MDRRDVYDMLVRRCAGWDLADLGDLLHEIDHDASLDGPTRTALRERLYRRIWERARPLLGRDESAAVLAHGGRTATEPRNPAPCSVMPASEIVDPDERASD